MSLPFRIVNTCLGITAKDNVTIYLYPHNIPLAEEIAEECFKKGADVLLNLYTDRYLLSYMNELSIESLRQPSVFCRALTEISTVEIWAGATYDPSILRSIPPEKDAAASQGEAAAHWPMAKEKKVRTLGVGLALVTEPRAKAYGFDYKQWSRMMTEASNVNYSVLVEKGHALQRILSSSESFHVRSEDGTDLKFKTSGRRWRVSDGVIDEEDMKGGNLDDHIPAGNIYIAPLEDSAEGTVVCNVQEPYRGRQVSRVRWAFKEGRAVDFSGDESIGRLKDDWDKAGGDKDRFAYFSIGFNPRAQPNYTINSVVEGTASVGIGGNEDIGGINKPGFFYIGSLSGATVNADGNLVVKEGKLT